MANGDSGTGAGVNPLDFLTGFLAGYKTIIAGIGLIGLGVYELSQNQMDQALAHIAQGLGLIGLRSAVRQLSKQGEAGPDMKRAASLLLAVGGLVLLSACGTTGSTKPTTTVDPVMSAADLGDIGCTGLLVELKPAQLAQAKVALGKMDAVLASDSPTLSAISEIITATSLDPKWQALGRSLVRRIVARIGTGVDPIPKDSVGFNMATAFADACGAAFGV